MIRIFLLSALAALGLKTFAQGYTDARYMTHGLSLMATNPSFAGSNGGPRIQASSRSLHRNGNALLNIFNASFDTYVPRIKAGISAGYTYRDDWSFRNNQALTLSYAQYLTLFEPDFILVPSLQVAVANERQAEVYFQPTPYINSYYADISAGALFIFDKAVRAGVSIFHANRPATGFYHRYNVIEKVVMHGSCVVFSNEKHMLQIFARYIRQIPDRTMDLSVQGIVARHWMAGAGFGFISYGSQRESWPFVNAGYRNSSFMAQITYNPIYLYSGIYWGNGLELHCSVNLKRKVTGKLTPLETL